MFRIGCLLVLLAGSVAVPLVAQSADPPPQSRIRVKQGPGSGWLTGTLLRSSADSLYLMSDRREVAVARDHVTRLDISRGRKSNTLRGIKYGAIVGAGMGTALAVGCLAEGDECWDDLPAAAFPLAVVLTTGLGGVVGAGLGTLMTTDRWEPVEPNPPAVTLLVSPGPNGARLGLSARF